MLYPLGECETQPLITVTNITLRNVVSTAGVLSPGIVRCNSTNPCSGINFENVQMEGWFNSAGLGYIVENAYGSVVNSFPVPDIKQ